jgi:hypothetical protein
MAGYLMAYACGAITVGNLWIFVNWRREVAEWRAGEAREAARDEERQQGRPP